MSGRLLLFHRDFLGYTGGHGKVWDYFNHAIALGWDARVHLTAGSLRDASNPWMAMPERIEPRWQPGQADALFLGGMDWQALPNGLETRMPVFNLVQHVRHADSALPLRGFLGRRAWRVCVSTPVAEAIDATGLVNGPIRVIPAALDAAVTSMASPPRRAGVFIAAQKHPQLGRALADVLADLDQPVRLADEWMPRADYLHALANATVAVTLPHATEGFFLPGLEAMALGAALVMPDSVGSREYAADDVNCLVPGATADALAVAVRRLCTDADLRTRLIEAGQTTAARHAPEQERGSFAALLREAFP